MWDVERHTCGEEDCEVAEGPEVMGVYGWHGGGWMWTAKKMYVRDREVQEQRGVRGMRGRRYVTGLIHYVIALLPQCSPKRRETPRPLKSRRADERTLIFIRKLPVDEGYTQCLTLDLKPLPTTPKSRPKRSRSPPLPAPCLSRTLSSRSSRPLSSTTVLPGV